MDIQTLPQDKKIVSLSKFADECGFSKNVVRGWADKGYLSIVKIGRHRLVDVPATIEKLRS